MTAPMTFHLIAYQALAICNPVELAAFDRVLDRATTLAPGDAALDIGCGNATVSIRLAQRGLAVTAVERDAAMADMAAGRIRAAGVEDRVILSRGLAQAELESGRLWSLIVVMGATDAVAPGVRDPATVFGALAQRMAPGGWLIWGEPFWKAEPSDGFRRLIETTNHYQTDEGWRAAAHEAGLETIAVEVSSDAAFAEYAGTMDQAVKRWADANPDRPETAGIVQRSDLIQAMYAGEGGRTLGFALYLFRRT